MAFSGSIRNGVNSGRRNESIDSTRTKYPPCSMTLKRWVWNGYHFERYADKSEKIPQPNHIAFHAGFAIDADGAPNAYGPNDIGIDHTANAGHKGNWWAVVTDNDKKTGNPIIQKTEDPCPGYYVSTTSLEDARYDERDPRRYVDSRVIPFIVLPKSILKLYEIGLGDFAMVVYHEPGTQGIQKKAYAIVADIGPPIKPLKNLGEGSIALAKLLGIRRTSPKSGGIDNGVLYVVFPGSGTQRPRTVEEIDKEGKRLESEYNEICLADEAKCKQSGAIQQRK